MQVVFHSSEQNKCLSVRDYLQSHGVDAVIEAMSDGSFVVQCPDEDLFIAKRQLAKIQNREDYSREVVGASWELENNDRGAPVKPVFSGGISAIKSAVCSWTVMIVCLVIYLMQLAFDRGGNAPVFQSLNFQGEAITNGELWRIFTPGFMHGSWVHILFNLVIFNYLASPLEVMLGRLRLLTVIVASDLLGNIIQYYAGGMDGNFCGLSGVVYGLVGYLAVMSRRADLAIGLRIIPGFFVVSLLFLVVSFVFFSDIAVFCHLGGLIAGLICGFVDMVSFGKQKR